MIFAKHCNQSSVKNSHTTSWFLLSKGNEYFYKVDKDFILDWFNLTVGLNSKVTNCSQASLGALAYLFMEDIENKSGIK